MTQEEAQEPLEIWPTCPNCNGNGDVVCRHSGMANVCRRCSGDGCVPPGSFIESTRPFGYYPPEIPPKYFKGLRV